VLVSRQNPYVWPHLLLRGGAELPNSDPSLFGRSALTGLFRAAGNFSKSAPNLLYGTGAPYLFLMRGGLPLVRICGAFRLPCPFPPAPPVSRLSRCQNILFRRRKSCSVIFQNGFPPRKYPTMFPADFFFFSPACSRTSPTAVLSAKPRTAIFFLW